VKQKVGVNYGSILTTQKSQIQVGQKTKKMFIFVSIYLITMKALLSVSILSRYHIKLITVQALFLSG